MRLSPGSTLISSRLYDEMVGKMLMHTSVEPENILQFEMIKEAVLSKIAQYLLMRGRTTVRERRS